MNSLLMFKQISPIMGFMWTFRTFECLVTPSFGGHHVSMVVSWQLTLLSNCCYFSVEMQGKKRLCNGGKYSFLSDLQIRDIITSPILFLLRGLSSSSPPLPLSRTSGCLIKRNFSFSPAKHKKRGKLQEREIVERRL